MAQPRDYSNHGLQSVFAAELATTSKNTGDSIMTDHNWTKKHDHQLIEIINSTDFNKYPNDVRTAARSEFNRRQIRNDKLMLYMTAIILILTLALVYSEFFHKTPSTPMAVPPDKVQSHQLNPIEKKETPQSKNDIRKKSRIAPPQ